LYTVIYFHSFKSILYFFSAFENWGKNMPPRRGGGKHPFGRKI